MKTISNYHKFHRLLIVSIGIILSGSISSCENFIDVGTPQTQLEGETIFEDTATADGALAYIYSSLQSNILVTGGPNGISVLMGAYSDELVSYSNYGLPDERFFTNNLLPDDSTVLSLWSDSYNLIYAANALNEGVTKSKHLEQASKDRLRGEALFIRSYIYYYLTSLFGDIPYATTTDYAVNTTLSKKTASEIYSFLIDDLQLAVSLLPAEYTSSNRVRPNKWTAQALLARVALILGKNDIALMASSVVIDQSSLYTITSNLDATFLTDCPGTLWQLMSPLEGMNTLEAENFIFDTAPPHTRALSNGIYESFEPGDLRKIHWVGTVSNGDVSYYYPNKYKQFTTTATSLEYSIQFRIEEQYLIRAEARVLTGDLQGAKDDLNVIRIRSGLTETTAATQSQLLTAILQERKIELFTEHGHRFFDLKRFNIATNVLQPIKPGWNPTDIVLPLPQKELQVNRNLLPQNQGY